MCLLSEVKILFLIDQIFRFRQCCCCWVDMKCPLLFPLLECLPNVKGYSSVRLKSTIWFKSVIVVCWWFYNLYYHFSRVWARANILEDWVSIKGLLFWIALGRRGKNDVLIKRFAILCGKKLHWGYTKCQMNIVSYCSVACIESLDEEYLLGSGDNILFRLVCSCLLFFLLPLVLPHCLLFFYIIFMVHYI